MFFDPAPAIKLDLVPIEKRHLESLVCNILRAGLLTKLKYDKLYLRKLLLLPTEIAFGYKRKNNKGYFHLFDLTHEYIQCSNI